ncbi:MAG TPA: hypothetical protein VFQ53_17780 [Kofleriaceae bacterium]|nr:hypothetical protein [Kofleriaceae bacterium]
MIRAGAPCLLALVALAAGCKRRDQAPPCAAVGAKFVLLAKKDLDAVKLDDDTRRLALDQLPAMRDSLVNACTDGQWTAAVRTCMVDASDRPDRTAHAVFEECQSQLTAEQRAALQRSARGEPNDR